MGEDNKREFFRKVLVRLNSSELFNSDIRKLSKYVFSNSNNSVSNYQYIYSVLDEDCCWIEISKNTTGLIFILSRKEESKSDDNTLDFTDLIFGDCRQLVFNWLTECESRIEIAQPSAKEILLDYISNRPVVVRKKVISLLPIVANYDIFQAIRVTRGDPNSEEIVEALNYYNNLKQNENQD